MYSGHLMDELMEMVARAEQNAHEMTAAPQAEPQPAGFYARHFIYETSNQQALAGVA